MSSNIAISAGVRSNMLALQQTNENILTVQNRLATGKKVNSALDNPTAFFTAEGLSNRASDLSNLQDSMTLATKSLEAADKGIKAIQALVNTAKGLANQAKQTSDTTTRAALAAQFDDLRTQIDQITDDSGYNGTNLIKATPDNMTVVFNEDASSDLTVNGADLSTGASGLNIAASAGSWASDANIDAAVTALDSATNTLRAQASTFGTNLTVVKTRKDFTTAMVNTLQAGADALTLADTNEEGAKLLALQTRQALGVQALSLASQSDQAVLRLF